MAYYGACLLNSTPTCEYMRWRILNESPTRFEIIQNSANETHYGSGINVQADQLLLFMDKANFNWKYGNDH